MKRRTLRKSSPLDALLTRTCSALLGALLMHPERWWYLSELARQLATTASSLQRELAALVAAGIVERQVDGNRSYYRADEGSPLFPELRGLIAKTVGLVDVLAEALGPLTKRIAVAAVHGSMARGDADASSDVDLLVVAEVGLAELAPRLRQAALRLGRDVRPTVYTPSEYAGKRAANDRFLLAATTGPMLFVVGSTRELGGPPSSAAHPGDASRPG